MTQTHNIYKPAHTTRQSSIARNSTDIRSAIAVLKFQLSIIRITHYWRTLQLLRSPAVSVERPPVKLNFCGYARSGDRPFRKKK
ncbi:hypothetical protein IQ269_22055 [Tychonema sp. LEGE 07199]|uniref:hypothetical protein n=1 Tax=unclassified Tychonema TaxID=2642144 RepID=UPI00187E597C|nr:MULTISPECIES: hypothetical protein [unclassified Tychonema]MBE9123407.1 hypothetical protein [Tychonema sp. LEGE 07199]MBE9132014.1 hypothetical protein [Tychonema sp. LEGE 07196]